MPFNAPKPAMYHMLKSMGINVEDLDAGIKGISLFASNLDARLAAMERKIDRILTMMENEGFQSPLSVVTPEDAGITITPR